MLRSNLAPRSYALIAGISLLAMTVLAIMAMMRLTETTASLAGISAIPDMTPSLSMPLVLFGVVAVLDLLVAWSLYHFFKPRDAQLSLLTAVMRVIYTGFLGFALTYVARAGDVLASAETPDANVIASALALMNRFEAIWDIGFFFFGLHLVLLGVLMFRDTTVRKILAILLFIAGAGYFADSILAVAMPEIVFEFALYTFVGELAFMIWLIAVGGRSSKS